MSMKRLGRYELVRLLGKGAMGMVYEGRDPNLDRRVAIKTIKVENLTAEESAEYELRFRTEARSAARLQHPNIVSVYDSDRDADIAFLVMEFIQGEDLKHHLDHGKVFTLDETAGIMGDLLAALEYAHLQNIVHRDVKPANLLLEASGRVKLTDFGVARIQDSGDATRTQGSMVGTLKYMSPEQVQGEAIDTRTDLYAAGIVLYQLLTGRRPFEGSNDFEIIQQIVSKPHQAPSEVIAHLPLSLDSVVARALAKSKAARFANAKDFAQALREAVQQAEDRTLSPPPRHGPAGKSTTWSKTLVADSALVGTSPSRSQSNGAGKSSGTSPSSGLGSGASTVTQEVELVYWKDIKESDDPEDFEEFLAKFPEGIYKDLARRKLRKLQAKTSGDALPDSQYGSSVFGVAEDAPATSTSPSSLAPSAPAAAGSAASAPGVPTMPSQTLPGAGTVPGLDEPTLVRPTTVSRIVEPIAAVPATEPLQSDLHGESDAKARRSSTLPWALGGVALLVAGMAYFWINGQPDVTEAAVDSARATAPLTLASAPMTGVPASAPWGGASAAAPVAVPALAKASAAPVSGAPAKHDSQDVNKPTVSVPKAGASAALAPTVAASKAKGAEKGAEKAVVSPKPKASTEAPAVAVVEPEPDPKKTCEGRWFISYQICLSEQCNKPTLANHPVCVERKRQEESNKRREF